MLNCPSCEYADFDKDKCKRLLIRLPHVCPYAEERKPRNNFERLKSMSMEEMADMFDKEISGGVICPPKHTYKYCAVGNCKQCWLDWLKEEI